MLDTPPRVFINIDDCFLIVEAFNYLFIYDEQTNECLEEYEFDNEHDLEEAKDWWFNFIFGYGEFAY